MALYTIYAVEASMFLDAKSESFDANMRQAQSGEDRGQVLENIEAHSHMTEIAI